MICDMLQNDLESSTFRNQAYFSFMFYLHDISIQSLKLVSYITVERKILQILIDEGGASKLKSGKLRNIMIVCPCLNIHVPKFQRNTIVDEVIVHENLLLKRHFFSRIPPLVSSSLNRSSLAFS